MMMDLLSIVIVVIDGCLGKNCQDEIDVGGDEDGGGGRSKINVVGVEEWEHRPPIPALLAVSLHGAC